jgi:hypothetical protein
LFRKLPTIEVICLLLLTVVVLECFSERVSAQHSKIPEEPFQVVDASTGKAIPEILVIPLYSSYKGIFISLNDLVDSPCVSIWTTPLFIVPESHSK